MDCCEAHDAAADELAELALDPTLQDCCRRDLEEQAYVEHIKSELLSHDRIDTRRVLASQILAPPPPRMRDSAEDEDLWGDGSSANDPELEEFRLRRLQQLQAEVLLKEQQQAKGFGRVTDVPERLFMEYVEDYTREAVVAHIAAEGDEVSCQLDEHLEALAHQYPGTSFIRTRASRRSSLYRRLGAPGATDMLVCFQAGALVPPCLTFDGEEAFVEEEVTRWLRQLKILRRQAEPSLNLGAQGTSVGNSDESEEDEEGDDWREPCAQCGRRYHHEHIRSVYRDNADEDDESGDEGSDEAS